MQEVMTEERGKCFQERTIGSKMGSENRGREMISKKSKN